MSATVLPPFLAPDFQVRIAQNFPTGWASPEAMQSGNIGALMLAWSQGLEVVQAQLQYTQNAIYLGTETAPELDLASMDFFGGALPRTPGQSDASFAAQIQAALLPSAQTRRAISAALERLTGSAPRMIEPWNTGDTGAWDTGSYWDIDTAANPARWAYMTPAMGYIISGPAVSQPALGGNPVLTFDDGAYWGVPGYFVGTILLTSTTSVYDLINSIRAFGVTIGVQILENIPVPTPGSQLTDSDGNPLFDDLGNALYGA